MADTLVEVSPVVVPAAASGDDRSSKAEKTDAEEFRRSEVQEFRREFQHVNALMKLIESRPNSCTSERLNSFVFVPMRS